MPPARPQPGRDVENFSFLDAVSIFTPASGAAEADR
jgi:hypothetical protein